MEKFDKIVRKILITYCIFIFCLFNISLTENKIKPQLEKWRKYEKNAYNYIWNNYNVEQNKRIEFNKYMKDQFNVIDGILINKIYKYSKKYNMNPKLVANFLYIESRFRQYAKSHCDARGISQLMLPTAKILNQKLKLVDKITIRNIYNIDINLELGIYYLSELKEEFDGDIINMVIAYNAGRYYTSKYITRIPDETKDYILLLLNRFKDINNLDFFDKNTKGFLD